MICRECSAQFVYDCRPGYGICERCYIAMEDAEIAMEDADNDEPCAVCGRSMEWVDCDQCDDGMVDESEDDPINFATGEEMTTCQECHGHGGWLECSGLPHTEQQMAEYRNGQ